MSALHTPGPWTFDASPGRDGRIYAAPDSRLPDYSNHGASIPLFAGYRATLPGDVILAAAAPDLAAALRDILTCEDPEYMRQLARAALARLAP